MNGSGKPEANRLAAFGEFVLRLHSEGSKRFLQAGSYAAYYAGAEANVCVLLSRLGATARYITRIPDNDIAHAGVEQLRSHGVETGKIVYGGEKLGLYFTEPGNGIRPTRVLYDRAGSAYSFLERGMIDWHAALENVQYFHWSGVAAAVSQGSADVCAEALEVATEKGIVVSSDFNYRTTLWNYGKKAAEVMPQLLRHSEVAVADLDSAAVYYGIQTDRATPFEKRFRQCSEALSQKLPRLKVLAMSFRETRGIHHVYSGALYYKGAFYMSPVSELPFVTDQIGSGDAFTGGMLFGLMNGFEPQQIIDFATACGALKQSIVGDWAVITRADVDQFLQNGSTGRIIR